jgi:hypothetical protein
MNTTLDTAAARKITDSATPASPQAPAIATAASTNTASAKPINTAAKVASKTTKPAASPKPRKVAAQPAKASQPVAAKAAKKPAEPVAKSAPRKAVKANAKPATQPAAKPPVAAVTVKAKSVAPKRRKPEKLAKPKLVRDSFTMPQADFDLVDVLKQRALNFRHSAKKGELLRAGLQALASLSDVQLQAALARVTPLKPGRPKKAD